MLSPDLSIGRHLVSTRRASQLRFSTSHSLVHCEECSLVSSSAKIDISREAHECSYLAPAAEEQRSAVRLPELQAAEIVAVHRPLSFSWDHRIVIASHVRLHDDSKRGEEARKKQERKRRFRALQLRRLSADFGVRRRPSFDVVNYEGPLSFSKHQLQQAPGQH